MCVGALTWLRCNELYGLTRSLCFPALTTPKHQVDGISVLKAACVSCACVIVWSGVHAVTVDTVDIPKDVYEVPRGDNVTLSCTFVPEVKPLLIIIT